MHALILIILFKMNKIRFLVLLFCLVNFSSQAQINENGYPFFRNYPPEEYGGSEQNWCMVQDGRGFMYIGNQDDGIFEFDGKNWTQIIIDNQSPVKSLAVDDRFTVFVGAIGEFGYLNPDQSGKLHYISLSNQLDSTENDFADIFRIICLPGKVFFCTIREIFQFDYQKVQKIATLPSYTFLTFYQNNNIYIGNYMDGLFQMKNDTFLLAPGGEFFSRKNIFSILSDKENMIIITGAEGFYRYNPVSGEISHDFFIDKDNYWKDGNYFYHSVLLPDGSIASATTNKGVFHISPDGNIKDLFYKGSGMLDDQCTYVFYPPNKSGLSDPLWVTNFQGLTKFEINSPFRFFGEESGLSGLILDIIRFEGKLYVATSAGVYVQKFDKNNMPYFEKVNGIDDQSWSLLRFYSNDKNREILLAGTNQGIYQITGNKAVNIDAMLVGNNPPERKLYIYKLIASSTIPDAFYAVGKNKVLISYKNNTWKIEKEKIFRSEIREEIRTLAEEPDGTIWFGTDYSGFYRHKNGRNQQFTEKDGLPSVNSCNVFQLNNKVVFGTINGFYTFDTIHNIFIPDSSFGKAFYKKEGTIFRVAQSENGDIWISLIHEKRKWVEHLVKENKGYMRDTMPFMRLPNNTADAVFCDAGITWFGMSKKIYSYNTHFAKDYFLPYNCHIRKVKISEDSVIFNGTFFAPAAENGIRTVIINQPEGQVYNIKYKYNNLTFYWSAAFFENEESLKYSWMLKGSDKPWSKWSSETHYPITNINEGDYIFKVKAINIYGVESQPATFAFYIKPPFYRTIVAYILYVVFLVSLIVVIVKAYTRKLELEKIQLEKIVAERTAEVVAQKSEIEKQRDEIVLQKQNIEASIHYASRIQTAILPHKDFIDNYLSEYFILWRPRDIVSGDFYWMTAKDDKIIVVAADCTGHGVPGAFMSMLGVSFLNEIVVKNGITNAHEILNHLRSNVKRTLDQTGKEGEAKDGMDIALSVFDLKNNRLQFSGAYNPCYLFRNGEFIEIKADRMPIGIYIKEKESFTLNEMDIQHGDVYYIFSDGYVSQFGGGTGEKFKSSRMRELLSQIHMKPMEEQKQILDQRIDEWRGDLEQVDDILVFGVRL